jgi:hypothetical protein
MHELSLLKRNKLFLDQKRKVHRRKVSEKKLKKT